jgi:hypothetical protein
MVIRYPDNFYADFGGLVIRNYIPILHEFLIARFQILTKIIFIF